MKYLSAVLICGAFGGPLGTGFVRTLHDLTPRFPDWTPWAMVGGCAAGMMLGLRQRGRRRRL